jgi:hypothetical protein
MSLLVEYKVVSHQAIQYTLNDPNAVGLVDAAAVVIGQMRWYALNDYFAGMVTMDK